MEVLATVRSWFDCVPARRLEESVQALLDDIVYSVAAVELIDTIVREYQSGQFATLFEAWQYPLKYSDECETRRFTSLAAWHTIP